MSTATAIAAGDDDPEVVAVRAFTRFYTRILDVLDEGLLHTPYSLTEARLIYELAQQDGGVETTELRRSLGIDAGYLSRLLARLTTDGIVARKRSPQDGRRQVVRLTAAGSKAFAVLDRRSVDQVVGLLAPLDRDQRRRLVGAMATVEELLGQRTPPEMVVLRPLESGDLGWVVQRHGVLYAQEYRWDETFEGLVARVVAEFVDQRGEHPGRVAGWIAEVDGQRAGCIFCMRKDDTTAQLRLLLVEPTARGAGIGARLIDECLRHARRTGYPRIVLWTNDPLVDARRLYERAGFELIEEEKHHSFGHDMVGQVFALPLDGTH